MKKVWLSTTLLVVLMPLMGAPARADRSYVVRPGDTLVGLARTFDTTVAALMSGNRLTSDLLRVGQVLRVPGGPTGGYRITFAQSGETLADIARRAGRTLASLLSANPGLGPDGVLPGAAIAVPPADGVTVIARPGDTVAGVAARVGVSATVLAEVNGLVDGQELRPGQPVLVPSSSAGVGGGAGSAAGSAGVVRGPVAAAAVPSNAPPAPAVSVATPPAPARAGTSPAPVATFSTQLAVAGATAPRVMSAVAARDRLRRMQDQALRAAVARLPAVAFGSQTFLPPVQGVITSRFGWRALSVNGNHFHAGVDLAAPMGTPVHAARDGVVVKAGWGGTYGNVVFLDHGDGTQTRYAHLSRIDVRVGESVRQGDVLGLVGSTGASTGPHVHFELRFDGRAVNPLDYLQGLAGH